MDYHSGNGPFRIIEDLLNVSGIGEATLENITDLITVSD
jgi:competence ComEA-like helix-hairpin-helix protein